MSSKFEDTYQDDDLAHAAVLVDVGVRRGCGGRWQDLEEGTEAVLRAVEHFTSFTG
jgi:hypothetical protein